MTTYMPNDDYGAQHIAFTTPDNPTVQTRPVVGWGNAGEGWPHLTPVISTPDGPQEFPFDPARRFSYGYSADVAVWALGQRTNRDEARQEPQR